MAGIRSLGLTNERDFPVPNEPRPVRAAVYGNKMPRWRGKSFHQFSCLLETEIITIVTVGIDLAKNVVAVHCVDETGKAVLVWPEVALAKRLELMANLPPRLFVHRAHQGATRPSVDVQSVPCLIAASNH